MKGRQNHSGSADAALCAAAIEKGLLQQLQAAVRGKALDRDDVRAIRLERGNEATIHEHSVDQNGAGAALALATAFFCSCQSKLMPKNIQKALHRVNMH